MTQNQYSLESTISLWLFVIFFKFRSPGFFLFGWHKKKVDIVYTDFSRAFHRIDNGLLFIELESFGFSDSLVESYLSDQFMDVRVKKSISSRTKKMDFFKCSFIFIKQRTVELSHEFWDLCVTLKLYLFQYFFKFFKYPKK